MNIRKGVLIAAAMLLVGLCFADDSKRREPPKELLPLLDSPTEFSLHLADRAEIPDLGYNIFKRSIVSSVAKWRKEWGQSQVANEVLESALRDANKIDSPPTDRIDALWFIAGAFAEIAEAIQSVINTFA